MFGIKWGGGENSQKLTEAMKDDKNQTFSTIQSERFQEIINQPPPRPYKSQQKYGQWGIHPEQT